MEERIQKAGKGTRTISGIKRSRIAYHTKTNESNDAGAESVGLDETHDAESNKLLSNTTREIAVTSAASNNILVVRQYVDNLLDLDYKNVLSFTTINKPIYTYLSIKKNINHDENFELPNLMIYRAQLSPHCQYNLNSGICMILLDDTPSQLSQVLMITGNTMLMPNHSFETLLSSYDMNGEILFIFTNAIFRLSLKYLRDNVIDIVFTVNDKEVHYDICLIKLPSTIKNIKNMTFNSKSNVVKKIVRSKAIVRENGKYRIRTLQLNLDTVLNVPGKTEVNIRNQTKIYEYSHTHVPSTQVGTSGALILNDDNTPWGITTAANGSISCQFLNHYKF